MAECRIRVRTRGGELVSLRNREGTEYIWQGDPAFWSGQNPILFPIVGSLKDGRVDINGRTFEMGRHGFARGAADGGVGPDAEGQRSRARILHGEGGGKAVCEELVPDLEDEGVRKLGQGLGALPELQDGEVRTLVRPRTGTPSF